MFVSTCKLPYMIEEIMVSWVRSNRKKEKGRVMGKENESRVIKRNDLKPLYYLPSILRIE